jgi:hypothetical protein
VFVIPPWETSGLLPPGEHSATWDEVEATLGWTAHRQRLLSGFRDACLAVARAGSTAMWLDGSFVTDKETPGDYDACWDPAGVDPRLLDPLLLDATPAGRAARKAKYLGDVFIAGVERGSGLTFVQFFQRTRDGGTKGIVRLNPKEVS